ncbi:hypothetical protein MTO96_016224 [Rhipicephalus appendiculatus]
MPHHKPPAKRGSWGSFSRSSSIGKRGSRSSLDSDKRSSRSSLDSGHPPRKDSQPTASDAGKAVGHLAAAQPHDQRQTTTDAPHPPGSPTHAAPATTATTDAATRQAQRKGSIRRLSLMVGPNKFAFYVRRPTREELNTSNLKNVASKTHHDLKTDIDEPATTTRLRSWLVSQSAEGGFKTVIVAIILSAIVLLLVVLTLLRLYMHGTEATTPSWPFPVCNTTDCVAHAAALSSSVASAWDPCDDFGRFVCSAWKREHAPFAKSLTEQLIADSLLALARMNGTGDGVNLEDRPVQFMGLCMTARPDQEYAGLQAFKQFLSGEVNFLAALKYRDATYAGLLEALAILSGKWLVPLWFRLDFVMTGNASSIIIIDPEPLAAFWQQLHAMLNTTYATYVEQFIQVVYDGGAKPSLASPSYIKFLREESAAVQSNVLRVLSVTANSRLPVPVDGRLSDLPEFAPKFTGRAWAAAVSRLLGWSVSEEYVVHFSARQLLDAMNELARSTSAEQLLYHTVWWFVQQIGALTSNALFEATGVALGPAGNLYQGLLCGVQVSITYSTLLATRHATSVQPATRQSVDDTLNLVHSVAVTTVRASSNIGRLVRDSVYYMLLGTHPVVWPLPPNFDETKLLNYYGDTVDGSRAFFGHWHSSRLGIQRSFGRGIHTATAEFYKLDPTSLATYSPAFKGVSVATAAIHAPLFYGAGTAAMRFGGLGFTYAAQLVRNMDARALQDAAAVAESPAAQEADHLFESFECSDAKEKRAAFPHLPALVLAHAAYNKSLNGTAKDARLKGLEKLTSDASLLHDGVPQSMRGRRRGDDTGPATATPPRETSRPSSRPSAALSVHQ